MLDKLYYPEPDSAAIAVLVNGKPIHFTPLHELESTNALGLKAFFKNATAAQVTAALQLLSSDLQSGILVNPSDISQSIFVEATRLAEQFTPSIGCRSLDILHAAAAKVLAASEFITTERGNKARGRDGVQRRGLLKNLGLAKIQSHSTQAADLSLKDSRRHDPSLFGDCAGDYVLDQIFAVGGLGAE